jgi:hypothetical protein
MAPQMKLNEKDYPNFINLPDEDKERIRKAIAKRKRKLDKDKNPS